MSELIRQMLAANGSGWMPARQPYKFPPGFEPHGVEPPTAPQISEPVIEGVPPLPRGGQAAPPGTGRSLFDSPPTPIQEILPEERRFNIRNPKDAPFDLRKQTT